MTGPSDPKWVFDRDGRIVGFIPQSTKYLHLFSYIIRKTHNRQLVVYRFQMVGVDEDPFQVVQIP